MNHELTALRAGRRTDDLPGAVREKPLVIWTGPANPGVPAVPATNRPKASAASWTGDRSDEQAVLGRFGETAWLAIF